MGRYVYIAAEGSITGMAAIVESLEGNARTRLSSDGNVIGSKSSNNVWDELDQLECFCRKNATHIWTTGLTYGVGFCGGCINCSCTRSLAERSGLDL